MQSGSGTHTYNWSLGLGGPAGVNQVGGGNGYWEGLTTNPFSETLNSQIASNVPGTYTMASSGTAFCSCIEEQFYTDPWNDPTVLVTGPPTINSGGIGVYPTGGSGEIYTVEPGTSGQLAIYGTYLTAGGQDLSPTVTATNGISITGLTSVQDGQLNVSYNAANATPGTAYVTVKTNVGQTSPPQGSIAVGDLTPVITSISQSSFQAGQTYTNIVISGNNLGTACPSVTITGGGNTTFTPSPASCSNSSVSGTVAVDPNADPDAPGNTPANITLQSNGYGLGWRSQPGVPQGSGPLGINLTPPPPPTVSVTLSGSQIQANSTVYINPTPALPLSAVLVPGRQGVTLSGNASWSLAINYSGPGAYIYGCNFTATTAATSAWNIAAALSGNFCGGQAALSVTYQNYTQTFPFTISGQNASVTTVKSAIGTSPWFISNWLIPSRRAICSFKVTVNQCTARPTDSESCNSTTTTTFMNYGRGL